MNHKYQIGQVVELALPFRILEQITTDQGVEYLVVDPNGGKARVAEDNLRVHGAVPAERAGLLGAVQALRVPPTRRDDAGGALLRVLGEIVEISDAVQQFQAVRIRELQGVGSEIRAFGDLTVCFAPHKVNPQATIGRPVLVTIELR